MTGPGAAAYSLPHATVRVFYSRILTSETWQALIQAQSYDAVLSILAKTEYGDYLKIERHLLTPRRAVYQIRWHVADLYDKLINLVPKPARPLLLWMWRLYEVDNLKAILRGIESGAPWSQVRLLISPVARHATLNRADMQRMTESQDVVRAIGIIEHTPYYHTLIHAVERYRDEGSLFPLEVALDLEHGRQLWQSIQQLDGQDHQAALRVVGGQFDVNNLLWAIRYRVYHNLSEQEVVNYTLPYGHRVRDEDIRAIAAGTDIMQVVKRIYPNLEGLKPIQEDGEGVGTLELALKRHVVQLCHDAFLGYPFHIGLPAAYLLLTEYEIQDLTVLIEAKSTDLPLSVFGPMLVVEPPAYRAD